MKRLAGFAVGLLIPGLAMAQSWPAKPIRIVIAQARIAKAAGIKAE